MTFFDAILLGFVQGLTEFLPVSSSGHLVIFQRLLGLKEHSLEFDVIVHVATVGAVLLYFARDLKSLISGSLGALSGKGDKWNEPGARLATLIVVGSIPTAIIGLAFENLFERLFENPAAVAAFLIVTSALLFLTWKISRKPSPERSEQARAATLTPARAAIVGIAQGAAIAPGISRSGATIATGMLLGVDRELAARFSFLLSIPAVLGALVLRTRHFDAIPGDQWGAYAAGFVVSFVSGLGALALLMRFVRRGALHWFGFYTLAMAAVAWSLR